jgi:hypothetical protein
MQLHPNDTDGSARYVAQSLSAGFVGLDFIEDVGDLKQTTYEALPTKQKNYWAFAHEMAEGDHILIFVHHFPFALVTVSGPYNYIKNTVPEIGVWFRHFRKVTDVRYYIDFNKNANSWEKLTMTATLTPLRRLDTESKLLIDKWVNAGSSDL